MTPGLTARLRYYWTIVVAGLLMFFVGVPVISIGHLLRITLGIEDFIFPFVKGACRIYMRAVGARVHVTGLENLDRGRTYLFAANHQSALDPPLLFTYLGHNVGAIAKKELLKIPLFKQGFPLAHMVPIDRSNGIQAMESLRRGADELRRGHSLMAFPEGTRSFDGRVGKFKKGVFIMALEGGVPIAPVVINDSRLVIRRGVTACYPGEIHLQVLPPIETRGATTENLPELIEKVRNQIVAHVRTDYEV